MSKNKRYKVKKNKFLEWNYSNIANYNLLGRLMVSQMKMTGECKLTVKQVFNSCKHIPSFIVENSDKEYYQTHECELID